MELFFLFSILITLAALFSYLNVKTFKIPSGINLMLMGTLIAILCILIGKVSNSFTEFIKAELAQINFSDFLLGILLSFLLFAGSLHVKMNDLKKSAKSITSFAIFSTMASTAAVGVFFYFLSQLFSIQIPMVYCFLFGALISPTDPIAVIGILSKSKLPDTIKTNIIGESLFNDGIGVVIFAVLVQVNLAGLENISGLSIAKLFFQEAAGGILAGALIGYIGYRSMKTIDHFQTEILISLAMVMGGYSLCHYLHVSGPLAMVVAGLITGNKSRKDAMSDVTRDYLEKFWEVLDEVLNAILFMLIGLEIILIDFQLKYILLGLLVAFSIVLARYFSLWLPVKLFFRKDFQNSHLKIMTWSGLRGGISIALALSLTNSSFKSIIISITFSVVIFSILVQGFTIKNLINSVQKNSESKKGE
jgi:CPA1 family monovalent cation:H+ antiporter